MLSVFTAVFQPFKTIMAVTDDCIGCVSSAVFLHYVILFFFGMRQKQSFGTLNIMFRSQLGIPRRLRSVKGVPAKICPFVVVRSLDKLNIHFSKQIPDCFLLLSTVFSSPAVLQRYGRSGMIGKTELVVLIDQLPKRMNGYARVCFLNNIIAVMAQ